MNVRAPFRSRISVSRLAGVASVLTFCSTPLATRAQPGAGGDVTFGKDIVPILQRACQRCHNPNGVAPMSLGTYEEVRPWAKAMKERTSRGPHAGDARVERRGDCFQHYQRHSYAYRILTNLICSPGAKSDS